MNAAVNVVVNVAVKAACLKQTTVRPNIYILPLLPLVLPFFVRNFFAPRLCQLSSSSCQLSTFVRTMPPKAQPPNRGQWAAGQVNSLRFCTNGSVHDTLDQATQQMFLLAHQALTRTLPGAVQPAHTIQGGLNKNHYQVWYIYDTRVAEELRRVFATAPVCCTCW